jgi:hypothetical protein
LFHAFLSSSRHSYACQLTIFALAAHVGNFGVAGLRRLTLRRSRELAHALLAKLRNWRSTMPISAPNCIHFAADGRAELRAWNSLDSVPTNAGIQQEARKTLKRRLAYTLPITTS